MRLKLDWVSQEAARYAVMHWHYSQRMPSGKPGKVARIGVWEDGRFCGAVLFGSGNFQCCQPYKLHHTEVCELARVALSCHDTPVSRIVSIAVRMLRARNPGLRLIVSFADTSQGHHGGIYQAGGWVYVGASFDRVYRILGTVSHARSTHHRYGTASLAWLRQNVDPRAECIITEPKHKYLMPLTPETRARIQPLSLPYPKRAESKAGVALVDQTREGGSTPTSALHPSDSD